VFIFNGLLKYDCNRSATEFFHVVEYRVISDRYHLISVSEALTRAFAGPREEASNIKRKAGETPLFSRAGAA
jgi:hypothetical protein